MSIPTDSLTPNGTFSLYEDYENILSKISSEAIYKCIEKINEMRLCDIEYPLLEFNWYPIASHYYNYYFISFCIYVTAFI